MLYGLGKRRTSVATTADLRDPMSHRQNVVQCMFLELHQECMLGRATATNGMSSDQQQRACFVIFIYFTFLFIFFS